ncbi:MAG: CRISPR-associated endonuclease Cas2 [Actinomycetes bacterium]
MISDSVHRYLIAYDVKSDVRRARLAKILGSYGDRIQYSVFLLDVRPARLLRLKSALRSHVDLTTDSVLFCDLGPTAHGGESRVRFLGLERSVTGQEPLVL